MSFVGPTTRVGETWVRPHDLEILLSPAEDAAEAMIERVVHLGFEVRVELVRADREKVWAQLTRDQCEELELADGQIVYVRARPGARLRLGGGAAALDHVGERGLLEHAAHAGAQLVDIAQACRRAGVLSVLRAVAAHGRDRALDGPDHVRQADLRRRLRQPVAALGAALARDDPAAAEFVGDVLEELERDPLGGRERLALTKPAGDGASSSAPASRSRPSPRPAWA